MYLTKCMTSLSAIVPERSQLGPGCYRVPDPPVSVQHPRPDSHMRSVPATKYRGSSNQKSPSDMLWADSGAA